MARQAQSQSQSQVVPSKRGDFGLILERLKPAKISWAYLQRATGASGPHFYGILAGERDGKPARPSPELVAKFIDVLENLGVEVGHDDAEAMMSIAAKLPDGFSVVTTDRGVGTSEEIEYTPDPDFAVIREAYDGSDDAGRSYLRTTAEMIRIKAAQDAARRGAIGRRDESDG